MLILTEQNFPQAVLNERSQLRSPLFHLIDLSDNVEGQTLLCSPWWAGRKHICQIWRGGWAFWTPSQFCPAWIGATLHLQRGLLTWRRARLTSFCLFFCCCSSEMLRKMMLSCYGCCPTLGRMPRGCGPPPGSPQEAGPESAESLCTQAPAHRSLLHPYIFSGLSCKCPPLDIWEIWENVLLVFLSLLQEGKISFNQLELEEIGSN